MATQTLTVSLGLSAVNAVNGIFTLNASETDSLSYDDTVASSATVSAVTGGTGTQVLNKAVTKATYCYIKNLDTTNFVTLYNDDAEDWGRLLPGEFAFFPIAGAVGLEVKADTAACQIEYALFQEV
jgi:hypothetical protein